MDDERKLTVDPALRAIAELGLPLHSGLTLSPCARSVLLGGLDLISHLSSASQRDDHGRDALRYAVELGNVEACKELLAVSDSDEIVKSADSEGFTSLHAAAGRGDKEIVGMLIAKGADVKALTTKRGATPLVMACACMSWDAAGRLMDSQTVGVRDAEGMTPLHHVMKVAETSVGYMDCVEALIKAGAEIDAKDRMGRTPLHVACTRGLATASMYLIKRGANINARDVQDETPLHKCVKNPANLFGRSNCLITLLEANADVAVKRVDGTTPHGLLCRALKERTWSQGQKMAMEVSKKKLERAMEPVLVGAASSS